MTTPDERTRAIRWGRDDLLKIQHDGLVSDAVKQRAAEIYRNYPDEPMLQSWIDSASFTMPKETAVSLTAARQLFEDVRMADEWRGTPELQHSLLYTLRHFPMAFKLSRAQHMETDLPIGKKWVA